MRLIDEDALVDALMTYTWRDEDERTIDDADEKREYIKGWLPSVSTVSDWISVKDRLPKKFGEPCIVYNGCSVQYGDYYSDGIWYTPDCYESEEIRDVTHWRLLPEPPEEESND